MIFRRLANHSMQSPIFSRSLSTGLSVLLLMGSCSALSQSRLTPTLELEESFLSNETASLDESGQITRISPGILYQVTGSKSDFLLDYSLIGIYSSGLSQNDKIDQSLTLRSGISHIPDRWTSYLTGTIKQTNVSSDGVQTVNPVIQSNNTRELRTAGIGTDLQGKWGDAVNYQSAINADYADFENGEGSDSIGVSLGLSSRNSLKKLNWKAAVNSRIASTSGSDEQIDTFNAEINYRFSQKYRMFLALDKTNTDSGDPFLNDTNTNIGIHWTPDKNSSVRLGAGKRGDDTTYTLDTFLKTSRITYALNYDETVTTTRALLIEQTADQTAFAPSSQALSITPLLVKNGSVAITATGQRTDITLSYFEQSRSLKVNGIDEEKTDGLSIQVKRTLSALSSFQVAISSQKSQTSQKNIIDDASMTYSRQISQNSSLALELRKTKQKSDVIVNEYKQELLSLRWQATF